MNTNRFQVSIGIKERAHGNNYSKPILETGYLPIERAFDEVNQVMQNKFGVDGQIEITRQHRKRRNRE